MRAVLLLNGATFLTAGEEGSIVTHNGSVIPGKHKRRHSKFSACTVQALFTLADLSLPKQPLPMT